MARYLVLVPLLVLAALIQSLSGPRWPLVGGRPDLPLVMVLAWAMLRGSGPGAVAGFLGGLLLDAASYTPFGMNGALLGVIGYVSGLPEASVYRANIPFFLVVSVLATVIYHIASPVVLQASGYSLPPIVTTVQLIVPAAVLNAALLGPMFLLARRLVRVVDRTPQMQL